MTASGLLLCLHLFLFQGANADEVDVANAARSMLHAALAAGCADIARSLIKAKASVLYADVRNRNILFHAIFGGNPQAVDVALHFAPLVLV